MSRMEIRFVLIVLLFDAICLLFAVTQDDSLMLVKVNCSGALRHKRNWRYVNVPQNSNSYNLCVYQIPAPLCRYKPCTNRINNNYRPKIVYPYGVHDRKPIYSGPGKNWIGPKVGKLFVDFRKV